MGEDGKSGGVEGGLSKSVQSMQLKTIRPSHREIARRMALGQSQAEVARAMGMSQSRMSIICASPLFKRELARFMEARDASAVNVLKDIQELAPVALETIERTMYTTKSDNIRLKAATTLLDRGGFGPIQKGMLQVGGTVNVQTAHMSDSELRDLIRQRIERIRRADEERRKQEEALEAMDVEFEEAPAANNGDDGNSHPTGGRKAPINLISL